MRIKIHLSNSLRQSLSQRLQHAYKTGHLRMIKRIHALLHIADGQSVSAVSEWLHLGQQTVRDYLHSFLLCGPDSLVYKRPPGRPPRLTKTQRKALKELIIAGPEAAGYDSGCWTSLLIQDMILCRFGVLYHPHYICQLLHNLGFSFQKARFVSDHLDEAARAEWLAQTWPQILHLAKQKRALLLFGDEASFAQWGSLSYTWALKGHQPTLKTSGKRKAYKVLGLIDYFSGRLFYQGHSGRLNSESYAAFLQGVLQQAQQPIVLIQDRATYHTSKAMQAFFANHAERLTVFQLPAYSPDFNPIEFLWKKVKKLATHLKYFAEFPALVDAVNGTLLRFAQMPSEILSLMNHYCQPLGDVNP